MSTFEKRVVSGRDDVEERASGSISMNSSDLELGVDSEKPQQVGLRFTGIEIPKGAIITNAYLQFQSDEVSSTTTSLLIRGEDTDDAAAFANARNNVSSRLTTDASAAWTPPAWTTVNQADSAQRTPDLSAIVQEIVARPGWAASNDMAFVITGSGTRTAAAFEDNPAFAPLLHIGWSAGTPDTIAPTVSIVDLLEGGRVSGVVQLSVAAVDNVGIQGVQFRLDSETIGNPDASPAYTFNFDTTTQSNGTVTLTAIATDFAGNQTISSPVTVTIDNPLPPPPPPPPPSGTIRVPEDYATIQEAVNAAGNGDTVVVGPGTYTGGIVIAGKSITLTSAYQMAHNPTLINQTIISGGTPAVHVDASAPNTTVKGFHFVDGAKSVVFFAQGGQALDNFFDDTENDALSFENVGGIARGNHFFSPGDDGVDVDDARGDVIIENNTFEFARDDGIEIRNQNYTGTHVTLTIRGNTISGSGEDGIQLIDYSANSDRSFVIERNLIRASTDVGLGIMDNGETMEDFRAASMPERVHVFNNTFDGNAYGISGGDNLIAVNNIVSNSSVLGLKNVDSTSTVAYTLFFGNSIDQVGSNVDAATTLRGDPRYSSIFGLQPSSLAIDAGATSFVHSGETVLAVPSSAYNGVTADLGWHEFGS